MEHELMENKEGCEVTLKITVSAEEIHQQFNKEYHKLMQTAKVPGFRAGKVPRQILEARYGPDVEKEAIENLINSSYQKTIGERNIPVLSRPVIENIKYVNKDEPLSFTAKVEIKPKIELNNYKEIPLKKQVPKITDKDIENGLRRLQEKHAEIVIVEKPVGKDSLIIFDFETFEDKKPLPDGRQKDFLLEMGRNVFPPEFERQLLGMKKGAEKEFKIKLPKDYSDSNMAGQKITFKVKINEVKERKLQPLDDEFAKDLGEFDSIKEVKEAFKKDFINTAEFEATQKLKDEIMTILAAQHSFSLPKILIEKEIDYMLLTLLNNLQSYGLTLENYLKEKKVSIDVVRDEFRPQAVDRLKKLLILEAIADNEGIKVEDEEYETWVKTNFRTEPAKIKGYLENNEHKAGLKEDLRMQKTLNFLLEIADIKN
ncbi:MAG: trigger factor [bacterium]|nr:trigger factor [bacterium]